MIETRGLENVVIFIETILSFLLSRKIVIEKCTKNIEKSLGKHKKKDK